MTERREREVVHQDVIEVVRKVQQLLAGEGIASWIVPLPFHSPASTMPASGDFTPTIQYAQLEVLRVDVQRSAALLREHRRMLAEWSGFPE